MVAIRVWIITATASGQSSTYIHSITVQPATIHAPGTRHHRKHTGHATHHHIDNQITVLLVHHRDTKIAKQIVPIGKQTLSVWKMGIVLESNNGMLTQKGNESQGLTYKPNWHKFNTANCKENIIDSNVPIVITI